MRANWRLRTANRVLLELASWPAPDDDALYQGARRLLAPAQPPPLSEQSFPFNESFSLSSSSSSSTTTSSSLSPSRSSSFLPAPSPSLSLVELLDPGRTFSIVATSSRSRIRDTRWVGLKVKDGIVDAQRERYGRRATIDRANPDLALRVRLFEDRATLLLDTSGEPLDRRGYRIESTAAPLREQLSAAAVLASGWDGRGPVVDPMCGSGTLLAEAGAIAGGLAPNRLRARWGFEKLPVFDTALFARVRAEPFAAPDPGGALLGVDRDPSAIAAARANLSAAGLSLHAVLGVGDAFDFEPPPGPGLVAVNPPYGDRLAEDPEQWRRLGDLLKRRYRGWRAVVVAGDAALGRELGLRPERRIPFWNGPLEARLLVLALY